MQPIKNINIPQACHQSWREMTPAHKSRHCAQCSKIVTDFTSMSNNEIITYLAGSSNVCGRFEPRQLDSINQQLYTAPPSRKLKGWAMAIGLLGSITLFKANAQTVIPAVQTVLDSVKSMLPTGRTMGKIAVPPLRLVQGCVHDGKEALPGVMITPLGSSSGTVTDANGNFKLYLPLSATQFTVSFIGYSTQVLAVDPNDDTVYNVDLHENMMMLGEVVVVKHSLAKRVYYRYIKKPYNKVFK